MFESPTTAQQGKIIRRLLEEFKFQIKEGIYIKLGNKLHYNFGFLFLLPFPVSRPAGVGVIVEQNLIPKIMELTRG